MAFNWFFKAWVGGFNEFRRVRKQRKQKERGGDKPFTADSDINVLASVERLKEVEVEKLLSLIPFRNIMKGRKMNTAGWGQIALGLVDVFGQLPAGVTLPQGGGWMLLITGITTLTASARLKRMEK